MVPDKPQVQPTDIPPPPQSVSKTSSNAESPASTEQVPKPQEDAQKQSTWTGDEDNTVVHEPEETQSIETKVESKAPSIRQESQSSTLHDGNDFQALMKVKDAEPTSLEEAQGDNKLPGGFPEIDDAPEVETLSVKEIPQTDVLTQVEPKDEIDSETASLAQDSPADDHPTLEEDVRSASSNDVDDKAETINRLSDEVARLKKEVRAITGEKKEALQKAEKERVKMVDRMKAETEEIRRASKESEEAAKKETQRVKTLIAVERHSHTERVKGLDQEKDELVAALEAAKKETQRVKTLIAVERHSRSERMKEVEQEKEELVAALESAKKETQRVKTMIAVERHSHNERSKEFTQEKEKLAAALEATQFDLMASAAEIDSQSDRIRGLEGRLEESLEGNRGLYEKCQEQDRTTKRLQEEIVEERDRILMKDSQMNSQKAINQSLSTALLELQSKMNKAERHNRMLLEQIRQQSDQLQNRQYSETYLGLGRFMAANTLTAFSSLTRGIRRGANTARADAGLKGIKQLNDEIFQLAASLTDQLEAFEKRFVSDDTLSLLAGSERHEPVGVRRVKAEYLKSTLGLELINRLEADAPKSMKDINPFYVQVALQGCLTACCMRIITSWYPSEWEYGRFLEVLYDRIRGTGEGNELGLAATLTKLTSGGVDMALNWRKTTQQNCVPTPGRERSGKLVDYLRDDLRTVLSVSGWSKESYVDELLENARDRLFNLVSLALQLNTMTANGVPGELEAILVERGSGFDWREMGDECAGDRSRRTELVQKEERVICPVGLGLRWSDGSDVDMPRLLLKPRVVLDSAIV